MAAKPVVQWSAIALGGVILLTVIFVLGYGLVAIPLLLLILAMFGGALLYWLAGEEDR